jgi:hypothetical protein
MPKRIFPSTHLKPDVTLSVIRLSWSPFIARRYLPSVLETLSRAIGRRIGRGIDSPGTKLIFQSTRPPFECDQIFSMNVDGSDVKLLNNGKGRTTCGFFFPDAKRFIYASTHLAGDACPPAPDRSQGYVWPIYPAYEIFSARLDGSGLTPLTRNPGYDAEGTISADGKKIVFTSMRSGDLDIYTMNADGSGAKRLTSDKRRALFLLGRQNHCLSGLPPKDQGGAEGIRIFARAEPDQTDESGDLHNVRRWVQ